MVYFEFSLSTISEYTNKEITQRHQIEGSSKLALRDMDEFDFNHTTTSSNHINTFTLRGQLLSCKYSHLEYIVNIGLGIFSHVVLLVLPGS